MDTETETEIETNENDIEHLLYEGSQNIDRDQDFWFPMRGETPNLLIDAATPLLGFSLRVRKLSQCDQVERLYNQIVKEINAIEIELTEYGYEHAIIMAYRYVLCTFLDEAVMRTTWGASSIWAEHSLLSKFHDETWGGEKVFAILTRLENEPNTYKDLLEFIFQCLNLGFEGKYSVVTNGAIERERLILKLHELLKTLNKSEPQKLSQATDHVVHSKYKLNNQIPIWSVFVCFFIALCLIYAGYSYVLHTKSQEVLEQLNQLL